LSSGVSIALVLAVLTMLTSAMGLTAASAGREALAQKEVEVARRLAEAGAAEAFVVLARSTVSAPASAGMVCVSSSPCSSGSPDYLGCYTYRGLTPYPAGSSCTAPGPFTGAGLVDPYTVWALGVTKAGTGFQVAVTISGRRSVVGWTERLR